MPCRAYVCPAPVLAKRTTSGTTSECRALTFFSSSNQHVKKEKKLHSGVQFFFSFLPLSFLAGILLIKNDAPETTSYNSPLFRDIVVRSWYRGRHSLTGLIKPIEFSHKDTVWSSPVFSGTSY